MAVTGAEPIPADLIEKWAEHIKPRQQASFRQAFANANTQSINDTPRPYFATWTTSLVGSDLDILRSICRDERLRTLVKTLIIEDDSETVDPYVASELPTGNFPYHIWPRDEQGVVVASEIGVADLGWALGEGLLRLRLIKIRDYQICESNFSLCAEMVQTKRLFCETPPTAAEPVPLAAFAREIIQTIGVGVDCLTIKHVISSDHGQNSVINSAKFQEAHPGGASVGSPAIKEAVFEFPPNPIAKSDSPFSVLTSAQMILGEEARTYWLEEVFYKAPMLKSLILNLSVKDMQDHANLDPALVVPRLSEFSFTGTASTELLQTMLSSSKETLTRVSFRQVTLCRGSTWPELLSFLASNCPALTSFALGIVREGSGGSPAVDFREVRCENLPEEYRAGLHLDSRGPNLNKRTTRVRYDGNHAREILRILARYGYVPESTESGRRRANS